MSDVSDFLEKKQIEIKEKISEKAIKISVFFTLVSYLVLVWYIIGLQHPTAFEKTIAILFMFLLFILLGLMIWFIVDLHLSNRSVKLQCVKILKELEEEVDKDDA